MSRNVILVTVFLFFLLFQNCKEDNTFVFGQIPCDSNVALPEFDETKVRIIDPISQQYLRDTIIERIARANPIFLPCRKFIYMATYKDANGRTLSKQKVLLVSTGKRWQFGENDQIELIYQYDKSKLIAKDIPVNKDYPTIYEGRYGDESMSGLIDNDDKVWIHPFRSNQYILTEICPFPYIKKPFKIGKTWMSSIVIGKGWQMWENMSVSSHYEISKKDTIPLPFSDKKEPVIIVQAESNSQIGKSRATFTFSKTYGFITMDYTVFNGEKLVFDLIEVTDEKD